MLTLTPQGLFCPAGGFHIDPKGKVDHAIITHAHSDHARRGAALYSCVISGVDLLKMRLGKNITVQSFAFGETFTVGGVKVSFHPAGHILGSSQVRLEYNEEIWVVTGDYKRDPDPTCEPFESVKADVLVTEATFGTPSYTWNKSADLGKEIYEWWKRNADKEVNSVLYAYSLGKAQRVLGVLKPYKIPIYCHSAVTETNQHYRAQGIQLAETECLSRVKATEKLKGALILAPQSFLESPQAKILGNNYETAFASGWMARSHYGYEKGFVMSDHADWNDLIRTIQESGAQRVYVQHRGQGALVKHLRRLGLKAFPETELIAKNPEQFSFF